MKINVKPAVLHEEKKMKTRTWNPLNDYLFKFVFGRNERKKITLDLINAIFELNGQQQLEDIEFADRENDPIYEGDKLSRLDIYGLANDGSRINIELQVINQKNMEKRTLYYWSRMYQLKRGQKYEELNRAITINILNFELLPQEAEHNMYGIYDIKTGHRLTEDLEIHFLEIPKNKAKNIKEMKRIDKWMTYFSNQLSDEEMEAMAMREPAIKEALKAESLFMQDDLERRKYDQREKAIRDYESAMSAMFSEGRQEGRQEGRIEGNLEGKIEVAKNLLRRGIGLEEITDMTGLSKKQIEEFVKDQLN